MENTNDKMAFANSLPSPYPKHGKLSMLSGTRFSFDANKVYRMPSSEWESIKDNQTSVGKLVQYFITQHYSYQLPRIITLERYYSGDNDIHYWNSEKAADRADNRIASGLPRYITNIRVGYQYGNPIKWGYDNSKVDDAEEQVVTDLLKDFNSRTDEEYHEKAMGTSLVITGRAYELTYIHEDTNTPAVKAIDPANAFVVYDNSIDQHSLFAVRYYLMDYMDQSVFYIDVYTDDTIYHFKSATNPNGGLEVASASESHQFGQVPMTEYSLNDNRMGAWESKLDTIDSYDKALSGMANSEEDFGNAILVVSGDIETEEKETVTDIEGNQLYDDDGNPLVRVTTIDPKKKIMFLKPSIIDNPSGTATVVNSTAEYLTKSLDPQGWQTYIDQLMKDMHKDTNTPDMTDENFSGQATGAAMSYKLWGSNQEIATQESLYIKGLMRRLRLLGNYWTNINELPSEDMMEAFQPSFTLNLPKNDSEIIANLKALKDTGSISDQTIQERAEDVTGVPAEQEDSRMKDQSKANQQEAQAIAAQALADKDKTKVGDSNGDDNSSAGEGPNKPAPIAGRDE